MSAELPEDRVHEALGTLALRSGEFALAGRHFGWALSADPRNWRARRGLLEDLADSVDCAEVAVAVTEVDADRQVG